jgi:hypothetical protein
MNGINMEIKNRKYGIRTGIGNAAGKKTASETSTGTVKGVQTGTGKGETGQLQEQGQRKFYQQGHGQREKMTGTGASRNRDIGRDRDMTLITF